MIEVNLRYDLLLDIDFQAYLNWAQSAINLILQQPGMVEIRVNRNILGSPLIRSTFVWQSLSHWAKFVEGGEWPQMEAELRKYSANLKYELWGPSPVMPEPFRPNK